LRLLVFEKLSGKTSVRMLALARLCNVDNRFQFFFGGGGDNSVLWLSFAQQKNSDVSLEDKRS
jgi:hypothetical protein